MRKHILSKVIEARIVRVELPAAVDDNKEACLKVELHGIVQEFSGVILFLISQGFLSVTLRTLHGNFPLHFISS